MGASSKTNILVYGDPGVGKTTLIGSGGKRFKTLLIRPPFDHVDSIIGSGVKEEVVRDWDEMLDVLEYLRHEGDEWEWVWLDSISLFQDAGLTSLFYAAIERNEHRKEFGPDRPEYRVNMWRIEDWVRHAVGAELFNLGITAHPFWAVLASNEAPEESIEKLMPWIQGKAMPQKICGYMNVVGYMEADPSKEDTDRRLLYTKGNNRLYAKDTYGVLGKMINPTMPKIADLIAGKPKKRPATRRTRRTRRET